VNTAISFDGSTSTSSNGALQARWDWEDNGVWDTTLSTTLSATHAFPSAGSYSIRLEVRDAGGLTGTVAHAVSVAAAGSPGTPGAPTTSVGVDGVVSTNGWHMSAVNVTMSATSPSGSAMVTLYSLDSAAWTTYVGPFAVQGGNHTLHWQSIDAAGHIESMKSTSIRVDLKAPTLGSLSPSGRVTQSDVTISWAASDDASGIAKQEVSIDGGPFLSVGTATSTTLHLSNGPHQVWVKATDNAGRDSTTSGTFDVESSSLSLPDLPFGISWALALFIVVLAAVSFVVIGRGHRRNQRARREPRNRRQEFEPEAEEGNESFDL